MGMAWRNLAARAVDMRGDSGFGVGIGTEGLRDQGDKGYRGANAASVSGDAEQSVSGASIFAGENPMRQSSGILDRPSNLFQRKWTKPGKFASIPLTTATTGEKIPNLNQEHELSPNGPCKSIPVAGFSI